MLFPKYSCSMTQPLDNGIIKAFKEYNFNFLVSESLSKISQEENPQIVYKNNIMFDILY